MFGRKKHDPLMLCSFAANWLTSCQDAIRTELQPRKQVSQAKWIGVQESVLKVSFAGSNPELAECLAAREVVRLMQDDVQGSFILERDATNVITTLGVQMDDLAEVGIVVEEVKQ
ncbi:hypothetical protein ACH5RR_029568 [Cinchona calisaya]|uniref:RNase H type-1 domain-containing protein n=1 Tax=Cinchona calisaya TaxID=153742 RepID=A0ABD2YWG4_9GENT